MFDLTSSKLLILAIVALIVVGPKDLPALLRTVGKYMGVIRRHAAEFRAQLDEAIREAELDHLKKEFDTLGREMHASIEEGAQVPRDTPRDAETPRLGVDQAQGLDKAQSVGVPAAEAGQPAEAQPSAPKAEPRMTESSETGTER
jgi:sec-independent protein translocase protein TatB